MTERAAPRGPVVQLNAFQVLMRRWSKLHPYNAGQVMRISGSADLQRWKQAVEGVIGELGLGKARFTSGDYAAQFVPVDEIPIEQSFQDLQSFFNEELNRPFVAGDLPIRFCVLPGPTPANGTPMPVSHYLAAVYDHWIADSRAMRELMHRVFERYQYPDGQQPNPRLPALTLEAPDFQKLFGKHVGPLKRWAAMRESLKNIWHHRHAYRLNLMQPLDFTSRFVHRQLPDGLIGRLHRFAKSQAASVNDLFIALIAQSMGTYTADQRLGKTKKPLHFTRKHVGIGTIVDIRDAASQPLDQVFNLYLSSYTVLLEAPEKRPIDAVTRAVTARTGAIKKSLATVKGFWALVMARFWYDLYDSPRFRATLLHKTVPVVAGISNVNMSRSWADPAAAGESSKLDGEEVPQILDYLRISPTGPLIPLVFTLTTIGGRLSLCVTYRTTSFHEDRLLSLVNDFIERLKAIPEV
jgi:hypothetical protein